MGRKYKYSPKDKIQASQDYLSGRRSTKQICADLGIKMCIRDRVRELYASYVKNGVTKENILVGNGSSEFLGLIISDVINAGEKILTLSPECFCYEKYISLVNGEIIEYKCDKDGSFNIDDFIKLGKEEGVKLIMFSNPNNPTGHILTEEELSLIHIFL